LGVGIGQDCPYNSEPTARFSNGAWLTPYETLLDPRPQVMLQARSPNADDTRIDIDLGVQRNNVGLIHLQNLRVSSLATIRVRTSLNDPTFTTLGTDDFDSGVVTGWPQDKDPFSVTPWGDLTINGVYEPEEYIQLGMPRYFIPLSPVRARYVRINISDNTAEVPAHIGCLGICETWEPVRSPDYGWSITVIDESNIQTAPYGSRFFIKRGTRRRLNLGFSLIRQVPDPAQAKSDADLELMQKAMGWAMMVGKSIPIVIVPFPDDTPNVERRAVYGTISEDTVIDNPFFAEYRLPIVLEQLI
jgi:hypothetical protein